MSGFLVPLPPKNPSKSLSPKASLSTSKSRICGDTQGMSEKKKKPSHRSRRNFLTQVVSATGGAIAAPALLQSAQPSEPMVNAAPAQPGEVPVTLKVNGKPRTLNLEPRVTLLDALRERIGLTGSKKGCDHGQCGACTVLVEGQRVYACLSLAVMQEGKEITTIEGLARGELLHPVQTAFLEQDGLQCGYCTPGQICAAVALLEEVKRGSVSAVTPDLTQPPQLATLSTTEIRERLSGNLCRCSAYNGIVAAVQQASGQTPPSAAALIMTGGTP
jgi:xanthine dehydrogenase YagT iron-sulfur-binding subunit